MTLLDFLQLINSYDLKLQLSTFSKKIGQILQKILSAVKSTPWPI